MEYFLHFLISAFKDSLNEPKLTKNLAEVKAQAPATPEEHHCPGCRCFKRAKDIDSREGKFTRSKEGKIRQLLEKRFYPLKFSKVRPMWLLNPETGKPLELDMHCPELKVAVEYDGQQHFHYLPKYHKTQEGFEKMKQRDILKTQLCKQNNVHLIRVPYFITDAELENYVLAEIGKVI